MPAAPRHRSPFALSTWSDALGPRHRLLGIFLISVLGLFLEMLLVRWIGTEVRVFAYLQNTVLVCCFLGLGMGCFTCRRPIRMRRVLLPLAVLTTLLALPGTSAQLTEISDRLSRLPGVLIWRYEHVEVSIWRAIADVAIGLGWTALLMILVWEMFVPIGRLLGRLMDRVPNTIAAYSVNVAGSLVGIWLFVLVSAAYLPPAAWMLVVAGLMIAFIGRGRERVFNLALIVVILCGAKIAGHQPGAWRVTWSPYQKLVLLPTPEDRRHDGDVYITVNNVGYQAMVDLSEQAVARDPRIPAEMRGLSQYDVPLLLKPHPKNVLIVGAGSGNDAAGALRGRAEHVTAVDIDPAIITMGRQFHPEHPYDSPRVRVVIDDARSFFATTPEKYDLVIFGLLDSHTSTAMMNARLDHYVYTEESLRRARELLTDDGVMVLTFMVQEPFIADRIATSLTHVFGREPLVFARGASRLGWGGTAFVAGNPQAIEAGLQEHPALAANIRAWQAERPVELAGTTRVATDDWPYLYLQGPTIPVLYFILAALLGGLYCYGRLRLGGLGRGGRWTTVHWHFFFLGAAFLLLEVQNISKAAVVLGNTWLVNAVVISGVMIMILLANLIAARMPNLSTRIVGVCLIGSCVALYFVDLAQFALLAYPVKAVVVGLLTALPMFFSGILFIQSFSRTDRKDLALGANLIGSLVGAVLQSATFLLGVKALLLIVAGLYVAAIITRPKQPSQPSADDGDTVELDAREEPELVGV